MSDIIETDASNEPTVEPRTPSDLAQADKPTRAPKVDPTKPCYCSCFEVGDFDPAKVGTDDEEIFTTGCEQTTKRQFAQGHDARLVSFLVDGHFDGYSLRKVEGGVAQSFPNPESAARTASDALGDKAKTATENRSAKLEAKKAKEVERAATKQAKADEKAKAAAEKAAAKEKAAADKAAAKSTPQAEVAAGSQEGDLPALTSGQARIKVGRWEYVADINAETGEASYTDGKGELATIERDGYRLLDEAPVVA
jgi:hypothetical protein